MFQTIFLDLDDTLLDFGAAERVAITKTFTDIGIEPTPALLRRYSEINQSQWEALERGEITRETVLIRRFAILFAELGTAHDPAATEDIYRAYLAPKYDLYLASNGVAQTQYSRLESAGIGHYFKDIFISETTGHHKPERAYFDYCFAHIDGFDPARALMIGDSLTGDVLGGKNAGIKTCWFNPKHKPRRADIVPDFEVDRLDALRQLL